MNNLIIILLISIAIIIDNNLLSIKKIKSLNLFSQKNKINSQKNIWVYIPTEISSRFWNQFYSRRGIQYPNSIIELCIETILKHNNNIANINIITDNNINQYFKKCDIKNIAKIPKNMKLLYIQYYILYHYGGLWLKSSTICFNSLENVFHLLKINEIIMFDCDQNEILCNINSKYSLSSLASKKNNKIIKKILEFIIKQSNDLIENFNIEEQIQNILQINSKYIYHLNNLSRDYNNKSIYVENLISHNYTIVNNPNLLFLVINIEYINKYIKYHWLLRLNKEQLLNSNMWITKLFRYSLDKKQKVYKQNNLYTHTLIEDEINLVPENKNEMIHITKNYNLYQEYPYRIVDKEVIRNT